VQSQYPRVTAVEDCCCDWGAVVAGLVNDLCSTVKFYGKVFYSDLQISAFHLSYIQHIGFKLENEFKW
jgi:hypothetical protein